MRLSICLGIAAIVLPGIALETDQARRGEYLTVNVARCQDCHTQAGATSASGKSRWLRGAKLASPSQPGSAERSDFAPDITSAGALWKTWHYAGMVRFLTTGATPEGKTARLPMPEYRLRKDDAEAIAAYLQSLR